MKKPIALSELVLLPELHARSGGLKTGHIEDLALSLDAGESLPVPRVWVIPGRTGFHLSTGWHTEAAARKNGLKRLECEIRHGTLDEAKMDSAVGDLAHGLKRSADDKKKCVKMVLDVHPDWADRTVAKLVAVSASFVGEVRSQLSTVDSSNAKNTGKRVGRDGKKRALPKSKGEPDGGVPPPPDPDQLVKELHADLIRQVGKLPARGDGPCQVWKAGIVATVNKIVLKLGGKS